MNRGLKVAVSWSGGKDSCFSLFRSLLQSSSDCQICCLLNFINRDVGKSMSHGLDYRLIVAQAEALEIPIVQRETTWDTYEQEFKQAVAELKQHGVSTLVFGDIDIEGHKDWVERVCGELGVRPILPLWGDEPQKLLSGFIDAGFEAIVICAKAELFGEKWLGRRVDEVFAKDLLRLNNVHPCGEQGEYHTFVIDGPIFKRRMNIIDSEKVLREGYRFLNISRYEILSKSEV